MKRKIYKKKLRKKRSKNYIMLLISIIIMLYASFNIIVWKKDNNKNKVLNQKLKDLSLIEKVDMTVVENTLINPPKDKNNLYWKYIDLDFLSINFDELLMQNENTVGWIQVLGTDVDYPVVQTIDNEYYLNHSFDNTWNEAGWIFLDYRNDLKDLGHNTIIYGHSRLDDTMFGSLRYVLNDEWYQNNMNHIIKLSTLEYDSLWQIFSVYVIPNENYYITTYFNNNDSYQKFLNLMFNRSFRNFDTDVSTDDKILTLSTCSGNSGDKLVIQAKLIKKGTHL